CAASANSRTAVKRKRRKSCRRCGSLILSNHTYCKTCYPAKHYLSGKTLAQAIGSRKDANRYTGIRSNARKVFFASDRPKCCAACGYDKHIEICHVRDISEFPKHTLISVVNHPDNLLAANRQRIVEPEASFVRHSVTPGNVGRNRHHSRWLVSV